MAFDKQLLEIIACPLCKGKLTYHNGADELVCRFDRLAFPIRENIPVLLETEARELSVDELDKLPK